MIYDCILILVVDNLARDSPLQAVLSSSRFASPNLANLDLTISPDP